MTLDQLQRLPSKAQRGSKPRCHLLTHGDREEVAHRLTRLIEPWGQVGAENHWMPQGFENIEEAQLGRNDILCDPERGKALIRWWLVAPKGARVPNWDIATTCRIEGKEGILLVEAKAHDAELRVEEAGKRRNEAESKNSRSNRERIAGCISEASQSLTNASGMPCTLSIEHHYQMSNRFAWAWKLADLGFPVILVYLGFMKAGEMLLPFNSPSDWANTVVSHSRSLFPEQLWNQKWRVNGQAFISLIRSVELSLDESSLEANHDH